MLPTIDEMLFSSSQPKEDRVFSCLRNEDGKHSEFVQALQQHCDSLEHSIMMLDAAYEGYYLDAHKINVENGDNQDARLLIRQMVAYVHLATMLTSGEGTHYPQMMAKSVLHHRQTEGTYSNVHDLYMVESLDGLKDELSRLLPVLDAAFHDAGEELKKDQENATAKAAFQTAVAILKKAKAVNKKRKMLGAKLHDLEGNLLFGYDHRAGLYMLTPTTPQSIMEIVRQPLTQITCNGTTLHLDHGYQTSVKQVGH